MILKLKSLVLVLLLFLTFCSSPEQSSYNYSNNDNQVNDNYSNNNQYPIINDGPVSSDITRNIDYSKMNPIDLTVRFTFLNIVTDDLLNNFIKIKLINISDKYVTTIAFKQDDEISVISANLKPKESKTYKVETKYKSESEYLIESSKGSVNINKVRFKDGSFITRELIE